MIRFLMALGLALAAAASARAETPLERGAYLVRGIMACGNCHTPMGPQGPIRCNTDSLTYATLPYG